MEELLEIDGSYGEGGGQIVRTSLTLSALTNTPILIRNIRAGRSPPGLKAQHVAAAKAVRSICRGTLKGAEIGSMELSYLPGKIYGGKYRFNIGTAGSVILLAQTILPILFSASKPSIVEIYGGTDVPKAPNYDYFERVFVKALLLFGLDMTCTLNRAGYFPKEGGKITLEVFPGVPKPIAHWPSESSVRAVIALSNLPMGIAIREKKVLLNKGIEEVYIRERDADDPGNSLLIYTGLKGFSILGKKGLRAENVSSYAIAGLEQEGKVDVDQFLADQILIYAALAGKTSFKTSRVSKHTETNMFKIEKFLKKKFFCSGNSIKVD